MNENSEQTRPDDASWLQSLGGAAVESPRSHVTVTTAPPLDRDRPERRSLVPRGVWVGVILAALGASLISVLLVWSGSRQQVVVPSIVGADIGVARTTLKRIGLTVTVTEERFSSAQKDVVLEQLPAAGGTLSRGDTVEVVVSAGTEELTMPDVVGDGITLALGILEDMGLNVEVEQVVSDLASDTVVSSMPAAGAPVRSGDRIRLQVAAPRGSAVGLKPFQLEGIIVVIDPAPKPTGLSSDPSMEVARRLEAMLSASGASVVVSRSSLETATTESERAMKAAEASATVAVGLSVTTNPGAGRVVSVVPSATPDLGPRSSALGAALLTQLTPVAAPVKVTASTYDPVLSGARIPWLRLILGSTIAREDTVLYSDPGWADRVARALYSALGQTFGRPVLP